MKNLTHFFRSLLLLTISASTTVGNSEAKSWDNHPENPSKNVILLIGDGMGPQQIGLLLTYAKLAPNSIYADHNGVTAIEKMFNKGVTGLSLTSPADKVVVDSACSATQLATGHISGSEMIGLDAEGHRVETVLQLAQRMGKSTGLVSDTRITHATPASFAAHQPHRTFENEIAEQLVHSDVDVMLSGGLRHWLPQSVNDTNSALYKDLIKKTGNCMPISSKRTDQKNLLKKAKEAGYTLAFNRQELDNANGQKLLGLFANSGMANGIDNTRMKGDSTRTEPTLQEMSIKALQVLSQNENGFFLMIEGGQIDWSGHANDTADMLHNMIKFDDAIESVLEWAANREDTIIILTADHETGSFGFSYSRNNIPEGKPLPGKAFDGKLFKPNYNFMDRSTLDLIYQQKTDHFTTLAQFFSLPQEEQIPSTLAELIAKNTGFPITESEAATVLQSEPNKYHHEGHPYLHLENFPKVNDFEEFYVYGEEIRADLIGRVLSKYQNTVWGTGTHTATPVTVTAVGNVSVIEKVTGIKTHPEIGDFLKEIISRK